jgi:tagatose 6-phosphate kinase
MATVLCVTLNPGLDKTLTVPAWKPGDNVRGSVVREVVGGKGNNVARALARLGRAARPVMFLGGAVGARCESLLREDDRFDALITQSRAPTREILTVRTGATADQTAFFDPDPGISEEEALELYGRVESALTAGGIEALTLSGSSPTLATHGLFSDLIALANARGVPVFLDTYGPALEGISRFWPLAIQLNRREAGIRLRSATPSDEELSGLLDEWRRHGVHCGVITDGPSPARVHLHGQAYRVVSPSIDAVNPIGSGDCLLAGFVDGWLKGLAPELLLRHAFACAVANALVWDAGAIDPSEVECLSAEIRVELVTSR